MIPVAKKLQYSKKNLEIIILQKKIQSNLFVNIDQIVPKNI